MLVSLRRMQSDVSFIGFGEAAQAFVSGPQWSAQSRAYDRKTNDAALREAKLSDYAALNVAAATTCEEVMSSASHIFSLVTADQAELAALVASQHISPGALFFDMNSVAPSAKRAAAERIEQAGGRYVDVAVMAPVHPAQLNVPLLLSGPHCANAEQLLRAVGFSNIRIAGEDVGRASTIKMVRSVFIKGVEALSSECILAASAAGVTEDILASLGEDWSDRVNYNLERMLVHGHRRAAEMEQVAITLRDLGIEPLMTAGTVVRQRDLGDMGLSPAPDALSDKLTAIQNKNGSGTRK